MDLKLNDKLALVSGSTKGIGFAGDLSDPRQIEALIGRYPAVDGGVVRSAF